MASTPIKQLKHPHRVNPSTTDNAIEAYHRDPDTGAAIAFRIDGDEKPVNAIAGRNGGTLNPGGTPGNKGGGRRKMKSKAAIYRLNEKSMSLVEKAIDAGQMSVEEANKISTWTSKIIHPSEVVFLSAYVAKQLEEVAVMLAEFVPPERYEECLQRLELTLVSRSTEQETQDYSDYGNSE